jgi:hypothetical protein
MLMPNTLVELLTEKGVLSKPEILERIKKLTASPRPWLRETSAVRIPSRSRSPISGRQTG